MTCSTNVRRDLLRNTVPSQKIRRVLVCIPSCEVRIKKTFQQVTHYLFSEWLALHGSLIKLSALLVRFNIYAWSTARPMINHCVSVYSQLYVVDCVRGHPPTVYRSNFWSHFFPIARCEAKCRFFYSWISHMSFSAKARMYHRSAIGTDADDLLRYDNKIGREVMRCQRHLLYKLRYRT